LKERGLLYEKDGASWLKTEQFGDSKDRVLVKSDGNYTYFAADIAYHLDKLQRGYELLIDIWGADHHGHIPRMKAALEALGEDPEQLEIVIVQIVTLLRDGEEVRMSKRAGEFITLRDIVEEIGKDATRYFYVERSSDSHYDFDLAVAKEESANNPVYYIQYAHARISSMLKKAAAEGQKIEFALPEQGWKYLQTEDEKKLMWQLAGLPQAIQDSAAQRAPHILARYLYDLATIFHGFYNRCPVIGQEEEVSEARLFLVLATRQVIRKAAGILGISIPEQM
ncbi:MAG: arginine--tRNA ligase, partial [Halanaerobium sp.]|nr:arginine--tRNA ligase [Halanaerobium sp.]